MRAESSYGWLVAPSRGERLVIEEQLGAAFGTHARDHGLPSRAGTLEDLELDLLVTAYATKPRPAFTKLPFDYRRIPGPVRSAGLAVLERLAAGGTPDDFPRWPAEPRLDDLRAAAWADAAARAGIGLGRPRYPSGRGAVLITHDIDSRADVDRIEPIRTLERRHGFVSAVGFIPEVSWPAGAVIDGLLAEGCEVYCHDERHDGKLPYRTPAQLRGTFERFFAARPGLRQAVRGFRSGQLLMSTALLDAVAEWFDYDLSMPDTERGGPYGATAGCATVYPFLAGGLLEIPLTLSQDYYLRNVERLSGPAILAAWTEKLESTLARGGVAVLNTHPIWTRPEHPEVWSAFEGLLRAIEASGAWVTTPTALRTWLLGLRDG